MIRPSGSPVWVDRLNELHLLTPLRIALIVTVAIVLTVVVGRVVRRVVRRTIYIPGADRQRADARQQALAPALRSALIGVIWAVAVITIISEIGVNIGGLIATATVVGGAIAFGAQTLIRDAIAGFFVLAEDQYGAGDNVDLGLATGTVERITLRSVRLRDGEGRVWHVPHGGVARVGNLSKSSAVMLDIDVSRDSVIDQAIAVAEQLCVELAATSAVGAALTGPPTVAGLHDVLDDRLIVRVVAPSPPGTHDDVRRAWRRLVVDAFQRGDLTPPPPPPRP